MINNTRNSLGPEQAAPRNLREGAQQIEEFTADARDKFIRHQAVRYQTELLMAGIGQASRDAKEIMSKG